MPCDFRVDERGMTIACSRGSVRRRCATCGSPNVVALCDAVTERLAFGRKPRTCDAAMCADHRTMAGPNVDHCPNHIFAPRQEVGA